MIIYDFSTHLAITQIFIYNSIYNGSSLKNYKAVPQTTNIRVPQYSQVFILGILICAPRHIEGLFRPLPRKNLIRLRIFAYFSLIICALAHFYPLFSHLFICALVLFMSTCAQAQIFSYAHATRGLYVYGHSYAKSIFCHIRTYMLSHILYAPNNGEKCHRQIFYFRQFSQISQYLDILNAYFAIDAHIDIACVLFISSFEHMKNFSV